MIINSVESILARNMFFELQELSLRAKVYLKLEGLNVAGSIKIKTAIKMLDELESQDILNSSSVIIESSSGNLGIALSIVCHNRGYPFICVSDPNMLDVPKKLIKAYNAQLIIVDKRDENGGYLGERKKLLNKLLEDNPNYVWLNQYQNLSNPRAHYDSTAPEIYNAFSKVDYIFIGTGSTGTYNGCLEFFRQHSEKTKIIVVEPYGSVTYGGVAHARKIPGIGTSEEPWLASLNRPDDVIYVTERDTVLMCHELLEKYSLLVGGSTGTVVKAIQQYQDKLRENSTVVAISADFGEKYLDTVYNPSWVNCVTGLDIEAGEETSSVLSFVSQ